MATTTKKPPTRTPSPPQRSTRQKEAVVAVFASARGPLAFADLLKRAQKQAAGLGQATLYRHLKSLLAAGRVRAVALADGETRYESAGRQHHHHFHCRVCNEVVDIDSCPLARAGELSLPKGFVVESHEVTLYGVCGACQ